MHDPSSELYIPVWYILLPNKKEVTYWHALNNAIIFSDWKLTAASASCDAERGLLNQINKQFIEGNPQSFLHCCTFHFKYDNAKYLTKECHVSKDAAYRFLGEGGLFELLLVIPPTEIESKGNIDCQLNYNNILNGYVIFMTRYSIHQTKNGSRRSK